MLAIFYVDHKAQAPGAPVDTESSGLPLDTPVDESPVSSEVVALDKPVPPMLAIIVDDFGYGRSGTSTILELPYPLTLSVLPDLSMTKADYERAVRSGHQVILHLPMEPEGNGVSPGERAITVGMTEDEIRQTIEAFLEQVPAVGAANNHMGSRATADEGVMRVVIEVLKEHGMYWIDSSTTPDSKGPDVCRALGVPVVINNMFLDWEVTEEYIQDRLLAAAERARRKGYAVAIGHVSRIFADTLAAVLPKIAGSGVTLVTVDQLVDYLGYRY